MKIKQFVFNILRENTYVIYDEGCSDCAIIDPGMYYPEEREEIITFLNNHNLVPSKLLFTHCHVDHIFGAHFLKEQYPTIGCYAHQNEQYFIDNAQTQGSMFGVQIDTPPSISDYLYEGKELQVGNSNLRVIETPGHSPGGVCFYDEADSLVFTGDALFAGCIGRSDLYGGNEYKLVEGIRTKLCSLPENTAVLSGHGPQTTIGEEKHSNPYI
ncbi:MAG: MBL fold metallo-hydrolase [Bacteroidales bacterium]|nr:MBL fold metallo-hydrolase [Bacteroidales bacterium]